MSIHDDGQYLMHRELALDKAAYEIGDYCRKWGRINVLQTKEKNGTARVYCSIGYFSLHGLMYPGYASSQWRDHRIQWLWKFDIYYISPFLNTVFGRVLCWYQYKIYRFAYRKAIQNYPHLKWRILSGADAKELLKGL